MYSYYLVFLVALVYNFIGDKKKVSNPNLLIVFLSYLALFVGLGDMIGGYDRYIYGEAFDTIADIRISGNGYGSVLYLVQGSEYGYFVWQILCSFITSNRYVFIFLTTLLIYILCFLAIRKHVTNYPLACIIFLGFFYYFTMTYLRQVLAVTIVWQGVHYIWERKPIKFFLIVFVAYLFHSSALIFAPIYFLPIRMFSKRTIIVFLFLCLLIGLTPLPNALLGSAGEATGMVERTGAYEEQDAGFRWEYVLEVLFFVWVFFKNYSKISRDRVSLTFVNMSFVFCAILLIFIRFGQGGRLGWYFFIGIIYMLTTLSTKKEAYSWMKPLVITVCFLLFTRITIAWAPLNVPYKTFLTDGEPSGDGGIYSKYEYDTNYTRDKFYR